MIKKLTLVLCFILLCTFDQAAHAQESIPQVKVTQAWQGYTRVPGWIEVAYVIQNENDAWVGFLTVYDAANTITYQTPIVLPTQSQKAYRIPVLSSDGFDLSTNIIGDSGASEKIKLPVIDLDKNRICAYIGSSASEHLSELPECGTTIRLNSLTELPETPMVWDTVDILIINGTNTRSLSDKQALAMVAWVASGGHLIISGGMTLNLAIAPLPPVLQIVTHGPVEIVKTIPGVDPNAKGIASTQLQLNPESQPLVEIDTRIFAARQPLGMGIVDVIGWDVTQVSDTTWLQSLWINDHIPATANRIFGNNKTLSQTSPSVYELQEIPQNPMPKMWIWFIIFVLYIICIGPGTMLLTKQLNNPIYAWVLIPGWIAIALIVMSGVFGSTYGQTFPLVHDIAYITNNGANLPARVMQGTGITAPQSRHILWSSQGYLRPLWGQHVTDIWNSSGTSYPLLIEIESGQSQLSAEKPKGVITWGVEGIIDGIDIQANLSLSFMMKSPLITGTFSSEIDLKNANLVLQGRSSQTIRLMNNIEAHETVPISSTLPTGAAYPDMSYSICGFSDTPFRTPLVKPIQPPRIEELDITTTCYITALTGQVPFPTSDIAGSYTGESCIIQEIACPEQRTGSLEIHLLGYASGNDGGWMDTQMDIVSPSSPASIFTYHLPDFISLRQVSSITINLASHNGDQSQSLLDNESVILHLWDWQEDTWVQQTPQKKSNLLGFEFHIESQEAVKYFDPKHKTIQVQLIIPESTYPQFHVPMSIEGIW